MKRVVLNLATLIAGIMLGLLIGTKVIGAQRPDLPEATVNAGPTLESVRSLASLVTTKVTVSDVQLTRLQGYTGAAKAGLLVRGDFTIGTDLTLARLTSVNTSAKSLVLTLAPPTPGSPRVDLSRTRLVALGTEGLWDVVPGHVAEEEVADDAYRQAQQTILRLSRDPQWQQQARQQAESVVRTFFGSIGWRVSVEWEGDARSAPSGSTP